MKTPDRNDDDKMKKRVNNLFSDQPPPAYDSLSEVEAMKARIGELEAQLAGHPAAPAAKRAVSNTDTLPLGLQPPTLPVVAQPAQGGARFETSIQGKITLWAGVTLVLATIILIGYSLINLRNTALENAETEALAVAEAEAVTVKSQIEPALVTADTLAGTLGATKSRSNPVSLTRAQANGILQKVLEENPNFLGTWTLWEPNAFDGLDAEFANTPIHDSTGRFIPYWVRTGPDVIEGLAIEGYETPGIGDFYLVPRQTRQDTVTPPYIYEVQGVDVLMTSLVVPIIENNRFYGVAGVDFRVDFLQQLVDSIELYEGAAQVVLFTSDGTLVAVRNQPELALQPAGTYFTDFEQIQSTLDPAVSVVGQSADGQFLRVFSPISFGESNTTWYVGMSIPLSVVLAPAQQAIMVESIIGLLVLAVALGLLWFITGQVVRPIRDLTAVASAVAAGNLNVSANIKSGDEVGVLSNVFDTMLAQLRDLFTGMEQRVAERTHDIELATEVGRSVAERVGDLAELLEHSVELIRSRYELYYTQIYLLDSAGRNLVLRAGTGEAGQQLLRRGHRLELAANSLNSRAANSRKPVLVGDTETSEGFLPNPLLPLTRSELAVPLVVGDKVVGVLDMQSATPNAFTDANIPAFEVLASQLAVAIQNAALFRETEEARWVVEEQARHLASSGWREFLNAMERAETMGYAYSQDEVQPLDKARGESFENVLAIPIEFSGARIGEVQLADVASRQWAAAEVELIKTTIDSILQHVDNLRLLAQAERFRHEAEMVSRRLTAQGWNDYFRTRREVDGFAYREDRVLPIDGGNGHHGETGLRHPLVVREEQIGEVLVAPIAEAEDQEAEELLAAVAEKLSGHIENLRLLEQAEERRVELETVAELSSTASTVLDPDALLQTVVDLTKERFGLYHAHIYLTNDAWQMLILASGAGEVGRTLVAQEHTISMDAERSLVARAARERSPIIVNDVRSQPDFLPNALLPETRAEMAVPMIVGDKVLGVFDVQSATKDGFSAEDSAIYTTLASQVAVALQNARLYVEQAATVTQLRELDRLKSSFLANMSHELRTPLNSILGFTDVMLEGLDGDLTENMDNDLRLIQKNGQHLLHLINDVLDMAKIESGRMNLHPETFKVHSVIDEVVSITSTLASEKNLSLYIDDESNQEIEIYADNTRLRQVLINLVNNSIKFTDKGKISICARAIEGARVLISVTDTGIGIPEDKLEAVFQEFTQVDTSTTRKAGGTGLGLPISRRLVEMHGGRLWAESTGVEGEGSTFYVELPVEARISEVIEKQEREHGDA